MQFSYELAQSTESDLWSNWLNRRAQMKQEKISSMQVDIFVFYRASVVAG